MLEAVNALMLSSQSRCERGWVPAVPGTAFRVSVFQLLGLTSSISQILAWIWRHLRVAVPWWDWSISKTGLVFMRRRGKIVNDAGIALIIKQLLGDLVFLSALDPGLRSLPFALMKQGGIMLLTTARFWDYLLSLKLFPQKLQR